MSLAVKDLYQFLKTMFNEMANIHIYIFLGSNIEILNGNLRPNS